MIGDQYLNTTDPQHFNGTIHTLRFWNDPSSFDATDVAILYANRDSLTSTLTLITCPTTTITSQDSYTATYAWDFRESLTDFNGGETITLSEDTLMDVSGIEFNGSTTYATVPNTVQFGGTSTFALELYFTYYQNSDTRYFLDFTDSDETNRFIIRLYSSNDLNIYSKVNNSYLQPSVYNLTSNSQYHIVFVWTNSTTMDLYINGDWKSSHTLYIPPKSVQMMSRSFLILDLHQELK